jgi:hypothetical protein
LLILRRLFSVSHRANEKEEAGTAFVVEILAPYYLSTQGIPVKREQVGVPKRSDPIQVCLDFADLAFACASGGHL